MTDTGHSIAMGPKYRPELRCTKEERRGIVFYELVDPGTGASHRLYEIEYLILTDLDGHNDLPAIIRKAHEVHHFDLSIDDLKKYITQLDDMELLVPGSVGDTLTRDYSQISPPKDAEEPTVRPQAETASDKNTQAAATEATSAATTLDSSANAAIDEPTAKKSKSDKQRPSSRDPVRASPKRGKQPPRRQRSSSLLAAAIVVFVVLGGALYVSLDGPPISIRAMPLTPIPFVIYDQRPPLNLTPLRQQDLSFGRPGTISDLYVDVGAEVQQGDVLGILQVPKRLREKLEDGLDTYHGTRASQKDVRRQIARVRADKDQLKRERAAAAQILRELGDADLSEVEAELSQSEIKRQQVIRLRLNERIAELNQHERRLRATAARNQKSLQRLERRLRAIHSRMQGKVLLAPFSSRVAAIWREIEENVDTDETVITLRDTSETAIIFELDAEASIPAVGDDVSIGLPGAAPFVATATALDGIGKSELAGDKKTLTILTKALDFSINPDELRLVSESVDTAYVLPREALFVTKDDDAAAATGESNRSMLLAMPDNVARRVAVEVLATTGGEAIVRSTGEVFHPRAQVVVTRLGDDPSLSGIADGAEIARLP